MNRIVRQGSTSVWPKGRKRVEVTRASLFECPACAIQAGRFQTCPYSSEISFAIFARFAPKFPVPNSAATLIHTHHGSRAVSFRLECRVRERFLAALEMTAAVAVLLDEARSFPKLNRHATGGLNFFTESSRSG